MFTTLPKKNCRAVFLHHWNLFTLERLVFFRRLNCLHGGCQHLLLVLFDVLHQQLAYRNRFEKTQATQATGASWCIPGQLHHGKQQAFS